MEHEEKFEYCLSLVEGLLSAIPEDKKRQMYEKHKIALATSTTLLPTRKVNSSYKHFVDSQLRIIVINMLLDSEVGGMFLDLDDASIAKILNISPHKFAATVKNILRKIRLLNVKDANTNLQELKLQLEVIHYTDDIDLDNTD